MTPREPSTADIAVRIDCPDWDTLLPDVAARVRRTAAAALVLACPALGPAGLSVLLSDDAAMQALNRTWRGDDSPTNVLSFPSVAVAPGETPRPEFEGVPLELGDLALACETCAREAAAQAKPLGHHLDHLVVHGVLHLLGYDHQEDAEAERMERLEIPILGAIGVPDPYRAEAAHG